MKNLILAFAVLATISLTSCEKEYTCTCTTVDATGGTTTSSSPIKGNKDDARADCEQGSITTVGGTTTCTID